MKLKIKKNDTVRVISGRDKGKQGKVTQVFPTRGLLVVEGINLRTKHLRAQKGSKTGSKVQYAAPLTISKLAVICPQCGKTTRVRITQAPDGKKIRTCHHCTQPLNI
jgi:large subunit ribosomal protein L24